MKIDNSYEASVDGKWSNPGAPLFKAFLKEDNFEELVKEAYLIHHISDDEVYTNSDCKYPHHVIRNGKLVLHRSGVKAAYVRAKQMHVFEGKVKSHLEKHMNKLKEDGSMKECSDHFDKFRLGEDCYFDESVNPMDMSEFTEKDMEEMEKTIEAFYSDEVHFEDFHGDTRAFGDKVVKRYRGLPRVPNTPYGFSVLGHLLATYKFKHVPGFPIIGTDLRIFDPEDEPDKIDKNANKRKKFELDVTSEGDFIESAHISNQEGCSETIKTISSLLEEYPMKIVYPKPYGALDKNLKNCGGTAVIMLTYKELKSLREGGDLPRVPLGGRPETEPIFVCSLHNIPYPRTEYNLRLALRHESGHVNTMSRFFMNDF